TQVDVFTAEPLRGNPLAVVHAADGLSDLQMQQFARWTNLSETTFLLQPTSVEADYRVRIFTPGGELPFAGHPTLGSCHAWLERGTRAGSGPGWVGWCWRGRDLGGWLRLHGGPVAPSRSLAGGTWHAGAKWTRQGLPGPLVRGSAVYCRVQTTSEGHSLWKAN